ncbi:sulfurtransferase [Pseudomarimonas arenosa]|uniref:Sulfurtransferase n=1 Tax=Pseudomarimonas arenosa TaxID=2774145 RepID=A0AAW3ZKK8_9GAMM|nr:sulfurtransferase [Pseudomarimonas arenosa]MBD8526498.1 sulfurtransferase [Pseudomarimonas arenosa]
MSVLNIAAYHFVDLESVDQELERLQQACESHDLLGTVLVAPEGVNIFLAGGAAAVGAFVDWLRADARFAHIVIKYSHSERVPFARLRVRRKREIISFRQPHLRPVQQRAPSVDPATLKRWLDAGRDDHGRQVVLVDTRNQQEHCYGSFAAAIKLPIVKFTDLGTALEPHRADLRDKTVVSFCTGGVRCEKAALWMQEAGYGEVLQLDGGILGYFEHAGGAHYQGDCFVFDERVALKPDLSPLVDDTPIPAA